MPALVYRIDHLDRVVEVNSAWTDFAHANEGEAVHAERVLNRSLWDFIADDTVDDVYRRIVQRARDGATLSFRYRCDSPSRLRICRMTVEPMQDRAVRFTSTPVVEFKRVPLALLEPRRPATATFVRMCSWCHSLAWPGERWVPLEDAAERIQLLDPRMLPTLTHGICPDCAERMLRKLQRA